MNELFPTDKVYIIKDFKVYLKFKYNLSIIDNLKLITGWKYHPIKKVWSVPYSDFILEGVKGIGFTEFKKQQEKVYTAKLHKTNIEITKENRHPNLPLNSWYKLKELTGKVSISSNSSSWYLPNTPLVYSILESNGYKFEYIEEEVQIDWESIKLPKLTNYKSNTGKTFFPFQLDAVRFLQSRNGKAIIGDEMGTGKTIEALGYLLNNPELRPALILCKASAKLTWRREVREWIPNEPNIVFTGKTGNEPIITNIFTIYICNYDILESRLQQIIEKVKPKVIIADECQTVKNQDALRTKAFQSLCKGTEEEIENQKFLMDRKQLQIIPMSGTPIMNRPDEFFTVLNIVKPNNFPTWEWYKNRYCFQAIGYYDKENKQKRLEELHESVKNVMIRRLKKDVLTELPDKFRSVETIEIDNRIEYKRAEKEFIEWIQEEFGEDAALRASRAEQLVFINKMKMLCAKGKLAGIKTWIDDFLESGEKLIVFCTHKFVVDFLQIQYNGICVKLVGGMTAGAKQLSIDAFQENKEIKLFIGNLEAAGTSITLTAASNVLFTELGWTPGGHTQAEDRVHRHGQKSNVNCHYLIAENTIEVYLMDLISEKMKVLGKVLDGIEVEETSLLTGLMDIYLQK